MKQFETTEKKISKATYVWRDILNTIFSIFLNIN